MRRPVAARRKKIVEEAESNAVWLVIVTLMTSPGSFSTFAAPASRSAFRRFSRSCFWRSM